MRKANWPFYLYSLCAILLFACQDDNDPEITPSGNEDTFVGAQHVITLRDETEDFRYSGFTCTMSTEDGTIITRKGEHIRMEGKSILTLDTGLKKGIYRFLYLTTPIVAEAGADTTWLEYGLGCRVEISEVDTARVLDLYNKAMKLSGSGTEEDPFIISSSDHLKRIRNVANDQTKNNLLLPQTHFSQTADIDMTTSLAGYRSVTCRTTRSAVSTTATDIRSRTFGPNARTPPASPCSAIRKRQSLKISG